MPRPVPTPILHFTHVLNLPSVIANGLQGDRAVLEDGTAVVDIGMPGIKEERRRHPVDVEPFGVVGDYVPFYFAPRSPMMSSISHGNVPGYTNGCGPLVFLSTTVERLLESGLRVVATDRNARLNVAAFDVVEGEWGHSIDWDLMQATWWYNTPEEPDRRERRMAECLAHGTVTFDVVMEVVAMTEATATTARAAIGGAGLSTPVSVRPNWYI
jgi:hypothetical protein